MFRKLFPFLFKESPDGVYHWLTVDWCTLTGVGSHERCYSFKLDKVFLWEKDIEGLASREKAKCDERVLEKSDEIDGKSAEIAELNHTLELRNQRIDILVNDKEHFDEEYRALLQSNMTLEKALSIAEAMVSEKEKRIRRIQTDKARSEGKLQEEIDKRDRIIGEFKEFTHQERGKFRSQQLEDLQLYNDNLEKLKKEVEMLDKDFVDVAKAMRLFRQDEDRPVKGFRISK
jgi:small-conductance mechanosensitive channel